MKGVFILAETATEITLKTILTTYTSYAKTYIESRIPKKMSELTNDANYLKNTDTAAKATADASGNVITTTYATKTELTNGLAAKANAANVPTTKKFTEELAKKANTATTLAGYGITDSYTKTELNTKLTGKADKATTLAGYNISDAYTKTAVDSALANKLNVTTAASTYVPITQKGVANGIATLDNSGLVPPSQLPSYVDDVVEGYLNNGKFYKESAHTTLIAGMSGKIYVDITDGENKSYRYAPTSTSYIRIDNAVSTSDAAVHDASGNVITTTYATKADLATTTAKLNNYLLKTEFKAFTAGVDEAAISALWS